MTIFASRLLPLACLALCALPRAYADEFAAGRVPAVSAVARASVAHDLADSSLYAKYKRALTRSFSTGGSATDSAQPEGAAKLDPAPAARLKLAGRSTDGLKLGLTPTRDGGWGVTGAYSHAFGTRRLAMGAPR
jgi:hypothetical protein